MSAAWRALALIIVGGLSATALAKDKQPSAIVIGGGPAK